MDDVTLGKLLTEAHRGQADYCEPEGVSISQSSSSVVFDGSGKPDESVNFGATRNTYSAHSKFSENTQAEKVVDRSGKPEERDSSNAQIRTLLEEQRQMIIAEYCEKIGHHELQAAHAEEERRLLREELWRQKLEFREIHQQSLTEMEELRKFQSSTFDTIARRKLIEDQNTILELSGRVQELQNEVNCMNDSKDFQDAESVRSGNSHVTSQPGVFPKHPPFEGLLRPSFVSPRRTDGPPNIWDTSGKSGNVFANPQASSSAPYPQELNSPWKKTIEEPIHMSTAEKSERPERNQDLRCQSGPSAKDEIEQIRTLLERQREQILADCQAEIQKHEFQADYDRRCIQKLNEMIESQKEEICRAHQEDERRRQDHQLLYEQFLKQNWDLREAHEKSLYEMEELKLFQGSTFDTIARRKLVEDRDTILELTGKIQELQNEINCMNDSKNFQDAESVRSGNSHVTNRHQCHSHLIRYRKGC